MADEKPPTGFFSKPPQRPSTPLPPPSAMSSSASSTTVAPLPAATAEARPWTRYWARTLDKITDAIVETVKPYRADLRGLVLYVSRV